ncbi:sigma-54-dependent Fis family transcriptional regulator [Rhodococcus wratislaviensis]|uniref:sigma-54-dependent Fis family transcriptional regulator n=1 Tax=Rhodococcus wratislaviensis TaxID=44752 RepID=UPI0035171D6F
MAQRTGGGKSGRVAGPLDQERIRRAKEELLAKGLLDSGTLNTGVREVIDRSWRRCIGEEVQSVQPPYRGSLVTNSALEEAAEPVLARLADHLADVRVAMFLSDSSGNILSRKASEPRQRSRLDSAYAAEGFDFSERTIGTNGMGTSLAERRPLVIQGNEHFSERLAAFSCAGAPVFEPFTGRLLGTFSLAANTEDASPLMGAITVDVGRQIESNLAATLEMHDHALVRSYLYANRNKRDQVIVINEQTMFANTAGLSHLGPGTHAMLWHYLNDNAPTRDKCRMPIPLQSEWHEAEVEMIDRGSGSSPTYMIRVLPEQDSGLRLDRGESVTARRRSPKAKRSPRPPVHPVPAVDEQLSLVARHRECLALDGGPGTGKLHTATAFLRTHFAQQDPHVVDVATLLPDEGPQWFVAATAALESGRPVIVQHLQDLAPLQVNRVKALMRPAESHVPAVVTVEGDSAPAHVSSLISQMATTVALPDLRDMSEHIPGLIDAVLSELEGSEHSTKFSSEAQQLLIRWSWPGNLAELRRTVEQLVRRMPGRVIQIADLPAQIQGARTGRRLSMIETSERETILRALQQFSGNRSKAAEALGIGRTTLYRKMQAHNIEV